MKSPAFQVVLDTNILLRGLLNIRSASGRILQACERRDIIPLLSKSTLAEYRAILTNPEITERYPVLDEYKVKVVLERLAYIGDVIRRVGEQFEFPRDPKDAKFLELAIAARATHLITTDKDILLLREGRDDAATRFRRRTPSIEVVGPVEFIERFGNELRIR